METQAISRQNWGIAAAGTFLLGGGTLVALKLFNPNLYNTLKWPIGIVTVGGTGYSLVQLAQSRISNGGNRAPEPRGQLQKIWAQDPTDFASSLSQEEILEKAQLIARSHDPRAAGYLQALAETTDAPHKLADIAPETWQHVAESKRQACAGLVTTFAALQEVRPNLPADPDALASCIEQVVAETHPERHYYLELHNNHREALARALPSIKQHHPEAIEWVKDSALETGEFLPYILDADESWALDVAKRMSIYELPNLSEELTNTLYEKGDAALNEKLANAWCADRRYVELVDTNLALALAAAKKERLLQLAKWEGHLTPAVKLYEAGDAEFQKKMAGALKERVGDLLDGGHDNLAVEVANANLGRGLSIQTAIRLYDRDLELNKWLRHHNSKKIDKLVEADAMKFAAAVALETPGLTCSPESALALWNHDIRLHTKLLGLFKGRVDELVKANAMAFAGMAALEHDSVFSVESAIALYEVGTREGKAALADRCCLLVDKFVSKDAIAFAVEACKKYGAKYSVKTAARLWKEDDDDLKKKLILYNSEPIAKLVDVAPAFAVAVAKEASDQVLADLSDEVIKKLGNVDPLLAVRLASPKLLLHTTQLARIGKIPANAKPSGSIAQVIRKRAEAKDGDKYLEAVWNQVPHLVINCLDMLSKKQREPYVEKANQEGRNDKQWAEYLGTTCHLYAGTEQKILAILGLDVTKELLDAWPNDALFENLKPSELLFEEELPVYVDALVKRNGDGRRAFSVATRDEWEEKLIIALARQCKRSDFEGDWKSDEVHGLGGRTKREKEREKKRVERAKPYLQYMQMEKS